VTQTVDISRRNLLKGLPLSGTAPVRPPWSIREPDFLDGCTACGECVKACPEGIIINGAAGYPEVDFRRGECTFCSECATACPEPLFSVDKNPVWDLYLTVNDQCLATRRVICQTCGDVCDQQAIRFRPRLGDVAVPEVQQQDCNGCGACVSACPEEALVLGPRPPTDGGEQHV
jgi:ferredoxin-type protein NapF